MGRSDREERLQCQLRCLFSALREQSHVGRCVSVITHLDELFSFIRRQTVHRQPQDELEQICKSGIDGRTAQRGGEECQGVDERWQLYIMG